MDAFINIGSGAIKSKLTRIYGELGLGVLRLLLDAEWTPVRGAPVVGSRIVLTGHVGAAINQGASRVIAPIQPLYPIVFPAERPGASDVPVTLVAHVARTQVDALERERDGGPLTLHLHVHGYLLRRGGDSDPNDPDSFWGDLQYSVKAADWVEVLEHWRYAQGFLIQVPGFDGYDAAVMRQAQRQLDAAISAVNDGRYRDAVAACRDALEAAYGADDRALHPELGYRVENTQEADKDARFWLIRRALWVLTHAAKHNDDVTEQIEWHRRDALAAISILSALMQQEPSS